MMESYLEMNCSETKQKSSAQAQRELLAGPFLSSTFS